MGGVRGGRRDFVGPVRGLALSGQVQLGNPLKALLVMPPVFGGAPIVNVTYAIIAHPPKAAINPMLYVGFLLASIGAGMVLYFRPTA